MTFTIWLTIITQPSDVNSSYHAYYQYCIHFNYMQILLLNAAMMSLAQLQKHLHQIKELKWLGMTSVKIVSRHKQGFSHGHIMHSSQEYSQPVTWVTSYQLAYKYSHCTPPNTTLMCFSGISLWLKCTLQTIDGLCSPTMNVSEHPALVRDRLHVHLEYDVQLRTVVAGVSHVDKSNMPPSWITSQ